MNYYDININIYFFTLKLLHENIIKYSSRFEKIIVLICYSLFTVRIHDSINVLKLDY